MDQGSCAEEWCKSGSVHRGQRGVRGHEGGTGRVKEGAQE